MLWSKTLFQDATSDLMSLLIEFHNSSMITISMILCYVMVSTISFFTSTGSAIAPDAENHELEVGWTLLPGLTLMLLALPSLRLLYLMEESVSPCYTIKIIAHQWYWTYDYTSEYSDLIFDSYMEPPCMLKLGDLRLLEVDNMMNIPCDLETRLLLTSADVLHAWTVPSLGVKVDAIPGRLNQMIISPTKCGTYYGQCSEICGVNHSYMPIGVIVQPSKQWVEWVMYAEMVEQEFDSKTGEWVDVFYEDED